MPIANLEYFCENIGAIGIQSTPSLGLGMTTIRQEEYI